MAWRFAERPGSWETERSHSHIKYRIHLLISCECGGGRRTRSRDPVDDGGTTTTLSPVIILWDISLMPPKLVSIYGIRALSLVSPGPWAGEAAAHSETKWVSVAWFPSAAQFPVHKNWAVKCLSGT